MAQPSAHHGRHHARQPGAAVIPHDGIGAQPRREYAAIRQARGFGRPVDVAASFDAMLDALVDGLAPDGSRPAGQ